MLEYSKEQAMANNTKIDMTIFNLQAELSKTLSHPIRLALLHSLRDSEKNVNELTEILGISQSNLSQHLALMRQKGILQTRRQGTCVYYSVVNGKINQACDMVREVLIDQLTQKHKLTKGLSER